MKRFSLSIASVILFIAATGCSEDVASKGTEDTTTVTVQAIRANRLSEYSYLQHFFGKIQPSQRTALSFEIPGQVVNLSFDEGDVVEAGESVAVLDTAILESQKRQVLAKKQVEMMILQRLEAGERKEVVEAARALVRKTKAELQQVSLERDRLESLIPNNAVTKTEYEAAVYRAESLEAAVDVAKARLKELENGTREEDVAAQRNRIAALDAEAAALDTRMAKAVLKAPFSANITKRLVDDGAVVNEGQPVFAISEKHRPEARFSVPKAQLEQAKTVSEIEVGDRTFSVRKQRLVPSVSRDTRTVDVVYELEFEADVMEGETCRLSLSEIVRLECVELPLSALVPSIRGLWSCYSLKEIAASDFYLVTRVDLTVYHTSGEKVYAQTSLSDGALVVTEGVHKIVPGMSVRIAGDTL